MFEIKTTKSTDKNKIIFNPKGIYDFIGRSNINNGVQGRIDKQKYAPNPKNTFSLVQVGESVCLFRDTEWYASQNIFILMPKINELIKQHLFISSAINKALSTYKSAYIYPTLSDVKEKIIKMPITKNNKIDFDFMEAFIAELEAERIAELNAYLTASGLDNYELSDEEMSALADFEALEWEDFKLTEILTPKNTRSILSSSIIENSGTTPYLCASAENNSVSTYVDYDKNMLDEGNCIFIGGKTFVISYQKDDFYSNDSHNLALYLINEDYRKKLPQLYIATCIYKSLKHKYSWGDSVSKSKIKKDKIYLPSKNGMPDYEIMETFICAIQKIVIKDIVLYADKKIKASQKIVDF